MTRPAARLGLDTLPPPIRQALAEVADVLGTSSRAWVVGGAVRDALLARPVTDLDLAIPSGALAAGRALAARLSAPFVVLDERRGIDPS